MDDFLRFSDYAHVTIFSIVAKKEIFGCSLEFLACHVTEALCVIHQIVGNLILNNSGVILKRVLFVEKKMAAGRHLEFDKLVPRAQLCPPGS
jgi:hypothetical protein